MWKEWVRAYWKIAAAAVFLTAAGVLYGCFGRGKAELLPEADREPAARIETETLPGDGAETGGGNVQDPAGETTVQPAGVFVHVSGAVKKPGVYELDAGSRVFEAIEAAGGLAEDAAEESLNLAEKVFDGEKLTVLTAAEIEALDALQKERIRSGSAAKGTAGGGAENREAGGGRININTASKDELMSLSGIGESKASDIIRYREENGGFQRIEDIMKVPGIKNAGFQKIKDSIEV